MNPRSYLCLPNPTNSTKDPFNPLNQMIVQMSCILVMSHLFHLLLKPLGQTGPVSQILAGIVMSPTLLSRINKIEEFFIHGTSATYYLFFSFLFRTAFMFLIGLELDSDFLRRNFWKASTISYCGSASCTILGIFLFGLVRSYMDVEVNIFLFLIGFLIILSNSACPTVFQAVTDMKLDTSDIGRLAMSSALITEMTWVALYTILISLGSANRLRTFLMLYSLTAALMLIHKYLAPWFSTWYPTRKHLSKSQVGAFSVLILFLSSLFEVYGLNSALAIFLLGYMFPREGKAYRTFLRLLSYPIHEFILPIYFGYIGFRFSVTALNKYHYIIIALTVLFSIGGKLVGVFFACHSQKVPRRHWLFISSLLSLKGHVSLLLLDSNTDIKAWWSTTIHDTFVAATVITTLITGMLASYLLRSQGRSFAHEQTTLELHNTQNELRILSCIYGPRHTQGALSIISALSGTKQVPFTFTPMLMHLVGLKKKQKSSLMYHEQEDGEKFNYEDDFATNESLVIDDLVDSFTKESKILVHQSKIASPSSNMHEEICNSGENLRVSIIFLPFHKYQRIDGKSRNEGEEVRITNQKVLRSAPCSIGIFVDRNQTGFQQPHGSESVRRVAMLFFGGPDDREALALSKRFTLHSQIHLTVIRFLEKNLTEEYQITDTSHDCHEVSMAIPSNMTENERDNGLFGDFYSRYVTSGEVGYIEKHVTNGPQTAMILREIGEKYSLFVVGKGRGDSPMTTGMSDWEECPELGMVGDLLASTDINVNASVLVVQRHKSSHDNPLDDY